MNRRNFLKAGLSTVALAGAAGFAGDMEAADQSQRSVRKTGEGEKADRPRASEGTAQDRPNILWLVSEDNAVSYTHLTLPTKRIV